MANDEYVLLVAIYQDDGLAGSEFDGPSLRGLAPGRSLVMA